MTMQANKEITANRKEAIDNFRFPTPWARSSQAAIEFNSAITMARTCSWSARAKNPALAELISRCLEISIHQDANEP
jgi:hypothetical protein